MITLQVPQIAELRNSQTDMRISSGKFRHMKSNRNSYNIEV